MSNKPEDLLGWASNTLVNGDGTEACFRACASRAYYSAYHSLQKVGDQLPLATEERKGVHDQLCGQLQSSPRPDNLKPYHTELRRIGYMLQQHKDMRIKADYKLDDDFSKDEAEVAIQQTKKINEVLNVIETI